MKAIKSNVRKAPVQLSVNCTLLVMVGVYFPCKIAALANTSIERTERNFIEEWEKVPAAQVDIPPISKEQLVAQIQKTLEAQKALSSWEAKYRTTSRQSQQAFHRTMPPDPKYDTSNLKMASIKEAQIISDGAMWFYEERIKYMDADGKSRQMQHSRYACNGQTITMLWPDDKSAQFKDAQEVEIISGATSIADFMPSLPAESCLRHDSDFPPVLEILDAPDIQLMPWYTRVDGQTCYVLEQTTTLKQPIFKDREELEKWKVENPEEADAWSKIARYALVFIIYPQGQPGGGDTRVIETKFRLAIAPKLGFAIVHWAYGYGARSGPVQGFVFPDREIKYSNFRKVSKNLLIPYQMVYTNYNIDHNGQRSVFKETQLTIEQFAFDKQYQPELFQFDIPEGYSVIDADRGIIYTVGDSPEKIEILLAGAKARDAFYKKLSEGPAPSLEPTQWLNNEPIRLSEQVGREVILHFWGIGCAPCLAELPNLQRQYGLNSKYAPLFISIHPYVEGKYLETLKDIISKQGITFPVMVDKKVIGKPYWGRTFMKYMVDSIPTDIKIDKTGHIEFESLQKDLIEDLIDYKSRWIEIAEQ
jgi:thiol-disulfide isomerase/thioredoxin